MLFTVLSFSNLLLSVLGSAETKKLPGYNLIIIFILLRVEVMETLDRYPISPKKKAVSQCAIYATNRIIYVNINHQKNYVKTTV